MRVVLPALLWAVTLFAEGTVVVAQDPPAPVPDLASQEEARKLIQELFKDDYAKKDTAEGREVLIEKLLEQARETNDDLAARFVLFVEAKNLAVVAGDVETALGAAHGLEQSFKVDGVGIKEEALEIIAEKARTSEDRRAVASAQLALVVEAVRADKYDLAKKLANAAANQFRRGRAVALMNEARKRAREVDTLREEYEAAKKAIDALAATPNDPAINLRVGRFHCLVKGEWEKGLPFLIKGADADLRVQAAKDLQKPFEAGKQVIVGDGWWKLGENSTGVAKANLWLRAGHWYEKALPTLSGISKLKIEKRLVEIAQIQSGSMAMSPYISRKGLVAWWKLDMKRGTQAADASGNGNVGSFVNTPRRVRGRFDGALEFDGVGDHVQVAHTDALNAFPLTVSVWLRTRSSAGQYQSVVNKYEFFNGYHVYVAGGTVEAYYFKDKANNLGYQKSNVLKGGPVNDGTWHHVTFVVDSREGRVFVDGTLKARKPWLGTAGGCTTPRLFKIGRYSTTDHPFHGVIDDVRIYNRVLTAAEIKTLAGAGR